MKYKWGQLISLEYGKPVKDKSKVDGKYPVYGTNGQIGTSDLSPICNHPSFILGRKGAYRGVHYSPVPFLVIDTAFYAENLHPELLDIEWAYYKFLTYDINSMDSGSAIPSTDRYEIYAIEVDLPDYKSQKKKAELLRALDEKIELNNKINGNLEKTAQLLFLKYFGHISLNNLPEGWRSVKLDDVAVICKNSFNPVNESETLLEHYSIPAFDEARFPVFEPSSNIKSNKFKIDADCFMISKLNPTTKRVWKPYCLSGHAVCSTEFIVYKAKNRRDTDFLYSLIDSDAFSAFMCSHVTGSTGSRQRTTPSDTLQYTFAMPPQADIDAFTALVHPMYEQIRINAIGNDRLKKIRDSILPKLMSGELDVSSLLPVDC